MSVGDEDGTMPLPLVIADDNELAAAMCPDGKGPTPETPVGGAMLWWLCLEDPVRYRTALTRLSVNVADWDFAEVAAMLDGWSIMQHPIYSDERPDDLAYVKFLEGDSHSMQAEPSWISRRVSI